MQTVRGMVAVPPGERVTVELLSAAVIPVAEVVVAKVMIPLKVPMLVMVTVEDESHEPLVTVRLVGLMVMVKSGTGGILLKIAV